MPTYLLLSQLNFTAPPGFTSHQIWHEHLYAPSTSIFATNTDKEVWPIITRDLIF
jgi:hypothetical protein